MRARTPVPEPDDDDAGPRLKKVVATSGQAPPCLSPREVDLDAAGIDPGHRFPSTVTGEDELTGTAGIHPAVRHAPPFGARQPPAQTPPALEEAPPNTSLLGPFFSEATPTLAAGSSIARKPKPGKFGIARFLAASPIPPGKPVTNATVSIWRTGADEPSTTSGQRDIDRLSRRVRTDTNGVYVLRTVKPSDIDSDGRTGRRHGERKRGTAWGRRIFTSWPAHPAIAELVHRFSICATNLISPMTSCFGSSDDLRRRCGCQQSGLPRSRVCPASDSTCGLSRESNADRDHRARRRR